MDAMDTITLHHVLQHPHSENLLSGLVLIALLTYFYAAFAKVLKAGQGGKLQLGSRIYYSEDAAV